MKAHDTKFSSQNVAHDLKLTEDGEEIAYIHNQPMRFLGKLTFKDLKDKEIRESKSLVYGIKKMVIYNNAFLSQNDMGVYQAITYIESNLHQILEKMC